jgi:hypothetical protein
MERTETKHPAWQKPVVTKTHMQDSYKSNLILGLLSWSRYKLLQPLFPEQLFINV